MENSKLKIVLVVDSGAVYEVITDQPAEVVVVDRDTDVLDLEDLQMVEGESAYIYEALTESDVDPSRIKKIYKEVGR